MRINIICFVELLICHPVIVYIVIIKLDIGNRMPKTSKYMYDTN